MPGTGHSPACRRGIESELAKTPAGRERLWARCGEEKENIRKQPSHVEPPQEESLVGRNDNVTMNPGLGEPAQLAGEEMKAFKRRSLS